jgi:hypothetical protein
MNPCFSFFWYLRLYPEELVRVNLGASTIYGAQCRHTQHWKKVLNINLVEIAKPKDREKRMNTKEEGRLKDFIALGVIGFAIGTAIAGSAYQVSIAALLTGDLGKSALLNVFIGIFAYIPAGVIAGYLHYRLHNVESKMEGLTVGIMAFLAHLIITLFLTIGAMAVYGGNWGSAFQSWGISLVFALIFYPIGGFLSSMFEGLKTPMMSALKFQRGPSTLAPPPPPGVAANTCPTCGGPLRYIEQYHRWYCDKEQKYV